MFIGCGKKVSLTGSYENKGYTFTLNEDQTMSWSYKDSRGEGRWFENEGTLYMIHNDGSKEEFWMEEDKITNKITSIIFEKTK